VSADSGGDGRFVNAKGCEHLANRATAAASIKFRFLRN
jgi:hypothetical protein